MPIYEFRCECGNEFAIERQITKYPKAADCALCGRSVHRRIYSITVKRGPRTSRATAPRSPAAGGISDLSIVSAGSGIAGVWAGGPFELENVSIRGFSTGVIVGSRGHVEAKQLDVRENLQTGIDNAGEFEGPDTKF